MKTAEKAVRLLETYGKVILLQIEVSEDDLENQLALRENGFVCTDTVPDEKDSTLANMIFTWLNDDKERNRILRRFQQRVKDAHAPTTPRRRRPPK